MVKIDGEPLPVLSFENIKSIKLSHLGLNLVELWSVWEEEVDFGLQICPYFSEYKVVTTIRGRWRSDPPHIIFSLVPNSHSRPSDNTKFHEDINLQWKVGVMGKYAHPGVAKATMVKKKKIYRVYSRMNL